MNTYFHVGQALVARSSVQGMIAGATYVVLRVRERRTFAGNFVTYFLRDDSGAELSVGNGHLLLAPAEGV